MSFDKVEYIKLRKESSERTFQAAELLFADNYYNSAVNRLYYACFYIINALFVSTGYSAKTHSGNKTVFFEHFIKTKIFERKFGKLYSDLFEARQQGDYDGYFIFDKETVADLLPQVKEMIETIKNYIEK